MSCLIIDGGAMPAAVDGVSVLLWNTYSAEPPAASVSAYLERHGDRLRTKYLAFVHDLGTSIVNGRRVIDHFRQADGFSLWWMNRIAEKSPFKSTRLFDCLRLLALEEMLTELRPAHVTLQSADRDLSEAISGLCHQLDASFVWRPVPAATAPLSIRRAYEALPHWLKGLLSLRHVLLRWKFTALRPVAWASEPESVFFCSYLFNLDGEAARRNEFLSRQWEGLPAWLRDRGVRTNWLHQFLPDGGRDVASSVDLLKAFNKDAARQGAHAVLETFLTPSAVAAILRNWLWHISLGWRLRRIRDAFTPKESKASLWPLLRDDWHISISGTAAVTNCACRVLIDAALKDLPRQTRGVFLLEGQGWETALVHAWRKRGHGEIIGVPHSSMPFWYLSIYDDTRQYGAAGEKPLPDRWAVNGKHAWKELAGAGLPERRMARVEALRFQYLARLNGRGVADQRVRQRDQPPRLLLLGDFTRGQTVRMIRCLESAISRVRGGVEVAIKRHPVCPIDATDTGAMPCEFIEQPLGDVLGRFDIVFASSTTSAALDALLAGLPVIVFVDDTGFNQSPLRNVPNVRFVNAPSALADAIDALAGQRVDTPVEEFFWVDEALPKWSALLALPGPAHD